MPGWTNRGINHFQPDDSPLHISTTQMSVYVRVSEGLAHTDMHMYSATTIPHNTNPKISDHGGPTVRISTKMEENTVSIHIFYLCYPF